MKILDDISQIIENVIMLFWLGCIPIGVISFLLGFGTYTYILLVLFLFDTIFGVLGLALEYGLDDSLYNELMSRTKKEVDHDVKVGKVSFIITGLIFITIAYLATKI